MYELSKEFRPSVSRGATHLNTSTTSKQRLNELLADQALGEEASKDDEKDLARLLAEFPEVDPDSYAIAAAAIHLALLAARLERLPNRVRHRLLGIANSIAGSRRSRPSPVRGPWLGWAAAAAATLLWIAQPARSIGSFTLAEVQDASDSISIAWSPTADPSGALATGNVVWSDQLKAGFMSFDGLPANDPEENQYQLWIFDAERLAEYPVDGGVFNSTGTAFRVPIDPKIDVANATLFAITLERPGGVVVSSRERLLLTATP